MVEAHRVMSRDFYHVNFRTSTFVRPEKLASRCAFIYIADDLARLGHTRNLFVVFKRFLSLSLRHIDLISSHAECYFLSLLFFAFGGFESPYSSQRIWGPIIGVEARLALFHSWKEMGY